LIRFLQALQGIVELAGALIDARLEHALRLVAHDPQAVSERERQQDHLQRRARLQRIIGEQVRRDQPPDIEGIDHGTDEIERPGEHKETRLLEAPPQQPAAHGQDGDDDRQRHEDYQLHHGSIGPHEHRCCHQRGDDLEAASPPVQAGHVALQIEKAPGELRHGHRGQTGRRQDEHHVESRPLGPQVLEREAVEGEREHADVRGGEHVEQVIAVAEAEEDDQVVENQRAEGSEIGPDEVAALLRRRQVRLALPEMQWHLQRALGLRADINCPG